MTSDALPYGRHVIDEDDVAAVAEVLRGDWLTTGPAVRAFEAALAERTGASHVASCSNGTAALHLASLALGLGPADTAIVPAITFAATANGARLCGAEVVFADVDPETGLMGPAHLEEAIARAKAAGRRPATAFPVHLAGQCDDLEGIAAVARRHGLAVVEDACHALGGRYRRHDGAWQPIGGSADSDATVFSFHPVKTITSGEGGAVATNRRDLGERIQRLRAHGITRDPAAFVDKELGFEGAIANPWYYEMIELGLNYRLPDINCALGLSQLRKLDRFARARAELARAYDERLAALHPLVQPLARTSWCEPVLHLYPVRIAFAEAGIARGQLMRTLAARSIHTQVHYIPVPRLPYYRARYGETRLPGAETYYERTLSLPLFPAMNIGDVERVVAALAEAVAPHARPRRRQAN